MAQARAILLSLLCVIVADYTDASGSGDPTHLVPSGTLGGGSTNARSNPIPLLLLVVVLVVVVLLVMVCGCCITICCVLGCCRYWSKRSVDPSVETGIEIENPAFQYTEPDSTKEGVLHNLDSPRNMRAHAPEFTQSSQSFVTMATPRLAVNRPISTSAVTISNKGLTISNKGALQVEVHLRASATPFTATQSLPTRMPHNQEQRHFQPSCGLSQTSLPPHLESTAPTSTTNEPQETEV